MSKSNLHIISPFTYNMAAPCILTMKFSMHSPIEKVKHSWDNRPVLQNSRCLAILKHWFVVSSLYTKGHHQDAFWLAHRYGSFSSSYSELRNLVSSSVALFEIKNHTILETRLFDSTNKLGWSVSIFWII